MSDTKPLFTKETFAFLHDLKKHKKKVWMDANRQRYQEALVRPFRKLLEETSQSILKIDQRFDVCGRRNFTRINRDIRFAKDKTPYRPQMYLKFCVPGNGEGETGELYVGLSAETVTVGFPNLCRIKTEGVCSGDDCRTANRQQSQVGGGTKEKARE